MPGDELSLTYGELAWELCEALLVLENAAEDVRAEQVLSLQSNSTEAYDAALVRYENAQLVLREYLKAEVKKADSILAWLNRTESLAAMRRKKGNELLEMARAGEAQAAWFKELTVRVMREMDLKKCEGANGFLRRHGNGGVQPVEVRQPELLPAKYQRFTLTISGEELAEIQRLMIKGGTIEQYKGRAKPIEPDTDLIRKDLLEESKCPKCDGIGANHNNSSAIPCDHCNRTGKVRGSVPGAVLLDRGEHLRCK